MYIEQQLSELTNAINNLEKQINYFNSGLQIMKDKLSTANSNNTENVIN